MGVFSCSSPDPPKMRWLQGCRRNLRIAASSRSLWHSGGRTRANTSTCATGHSHTLCYEKTLAAKAGRRCKGVQTPPRLALLRLSHAPAQKAPSPAPSILPESHAGCTSILLGARPICTSSIMLKCGSLLSAAAKALGKPTCTPAEFAAHGCPPSAPAP